MQIIDTIKKSGTELLLSGLFAFLGFLIGSIYSEIPPSFLPKILEDIPKLLLLKLFLMATIICVLLFAASLFFYLKSKNKLIPKFGVLWDKKGEAYCPSCEIILSEYHEQTSPLICSFNCVKCHTNIRLYNLGKSISLLDAQKLLNS